MSTEWLSRSEEMHTNPQIVTQNQTAKRIRQRSAVKVRTTELEEMADSQVSQSGSSMVTGEIRRYKMDLIDAEASRKTGSTTNSRKQRKASRSTSRERARVAAHSSTPARGVDEVSRSADATSSSGRHRKRSTSRERARTAARSSSSALGADEWHMPALAPGEERDGVSAKLQLSEAAAGLMPTTRHVLMQAVPAPPLNSAWGASIERTGWYYSRASPSWVFKACEGVLFHVDTSSLWELDSIFEDGQCAVRRMGAAWRNAVVGFAAMDYFVLLRICLVQWRRMTVQRNQVRPGFLHIMDQCIVCLEHFLIKDGFRSSGGAIRIPGCGHVLCVECLSNYALSAIELHQWSTDGVPCPMGDCRKHIAADFVLAAASFTTDQHDTLSVHLCRLLMVAPVHCPNPTCNALYDCGRDATDDPHVACYECRTEFCRDCRCTWHVGLTCAEYGRQLGGEDVPLMLLAEEFGWKRCGNCGAMVERLEGCNHVQCTSCGHHFCYRCGGPFDRVGYRCLNQSCGIYQRRTEVRPSQQVVAAVRRLFSFLAPAPLTDARRAFLQRWAETSKSSLDLSLLERGPLTWATLPAWQREMARNACCPYCQHQARHPCGRHLEALQRHLQMSCNAQVWTCCGKLFSTVEEMDVHVRDRHRDW